MTEIQGCRHWHPYTCARAEQCPQPCSRKAVLDEFEGPDPTDPDYAEVMKKKEAE